MEFGVWGLGFGVWGGGIGVRNFGIGVEGLRFRVWGPGLRVYVPAADPGVEREAAVLLHAIVVPVPRFCFRISVSWSLDSGFGCGVWGVGCGVWGVGLGCLVFSDG